MVDVSQNYLQKLVGDDGAPVSEAEEGVVSEDGGDSHGAGMHNPLVAECAERPVAVHECDAFTDEDLTEDGECRQHGGKSDLVVEGQHGEVVDLHTEKHTTE